VLKFEIFVVKFQAKKGRGGNFHPAIYIKGGGEMANL